MEYKLEGYNLFLEMMASIRRNTIFNVYMFQPAKVHAASHDNFFYILQHLAFCDRVLAPSKCGAPVFPHWRLPVCCIATFSFILP